jgi:hypothetical protein
MLEMFYGDLREYELSLVRDKEGRMEFEEKAKKAGSSQF